MNALPVPNPGRRLGVTPVATDEISTMQLGTLVLCLSCLAVGLLGLILRYDQPVVSAPAPLPTVAEILHVELSPDPLAPPDPAPPHSTLPPPPLAPWTAPAAPALAAVTEPNPAIASALPVKGPARIVDIHETVFRPSVSAATGRETTAATAPTTAPSVQALTYGHGEGKQPAPEYPSRAQRAGQEGSVRVLFTVGDDGRVLDAQSPAPCPWPLLTESALRVVRERWRFPTGPVRRFEVTIRFQLRK